MPLPPAWYLVLLPPVAVSTQRVFQDPDLIRDSIPTKIPPFCVADARNDLQPVVCRLYPEVARHLDWLQPIWRCAHDGFGRVRVCEFASEAAAVNVLQQLPSGMRGLVARGLDYHPLRAMCD